MINSNRMKIIYITISFLFISLLSAENTEEFQSPEWYIKVEEKISSSHAKGLEGLDALGQTLAYFGVSVRSSPDPRWQHCYYLAQDAIISIPGHASYFTYKLEALRADKDKIYNYYQDRILYFHDTFPHMPSPEVIRVLGPYLDDFRDSNSPILPPEKQTALESSNPNEMESKKSNAWYASYVLSKIGLRDFPPMAPHHLKDSVENWKKARAWYQEVKAGQRTFSFKGKSVEYRFKPDGTWDTIPIKNPPQDAIIYPDPEAVQVLAKRQKLELEQKEAEKAAEHKKVRQAQLMKLGWWFAGIVPLILIGLVWWRKTRKTHYN